MGSGRLTLGERSHGIHWTDGWAFASEWLTKSPIGTISGTKWLGREFDHCPFGTEVKCAWSYVRHVHLHGVHRGTFFLLSLITVIIIVIIIIIISYLGV
jgi:hypothetical protein